MFYNRPLKEIDIEHSSVCNAACPQCTRELIPGDYSWFKQTWLPLEFYERIPNSVYNDLETIFFSGMVGDPCSAPNFLEVCSYIKQQYPHINIKISTNGGMRNPSWWAELANILGKGSWVRFAVDGLEDTNHIYRVNVKWNKVIENIKAFNSAGGESEWQYIAFKHNEHQIEQANKLSKELGFSRFVIRKSHKFLIDQLFDFQFNGTGGVRIEQPSQDKFVHPIILQRKETFKLDEALKLSNDNTVSCDACNRDAMYISAEGYVFPCVYVGTCIHLNKHKRMPDNFMNIWENHGKGKVNLLTTDWDDILNGEFFKQIKNGWDYGYDNGRLAVCGLFCSESEARVFDPQVNYDVSFEGNSLP